MGICCLETSVINYQPMLHNIQQKRISHLHHGGNLRPQIFCMEFTNMAVAAPITSPGGPRVTDPWCR